MRGGAVEKGGNAPLPTDLSTEIKILRKLHLLYDMYHTEKKYYTDVNSLKTILVSQKDPTRQETVPTGRNQKKCFQGGKGAVAPQLWSAINFNRPEKGAGFFSPPKHLVPRRLIANLQYLWRFAAFCGFLRRFVVRWQ